MRPGAWHLTWLRRTGTGCMTGCLAADSLRHPTVWFVPGVEPEVRRGRGGAVSVTLFA